MRFRTRLGARVKLHLDARSFQREMAVIFSAEAPELVVFTEIQSGNNWRIHA